MRFADEIVTQSEKMNEQLDRRGFIKLAGLFSLGLASSRYAPFQNLYSPEKDIHNILIVVFDAFTAHNMSLYGYPRDTTPNINRLAKRAIVYHNHYAGGNYTTPGTASLLTGTLPWTHRAFGFNETVDKEFLQKNIFHVFSQYFRIAYTHNPVADTIIRQLNKDIDDYTHPEKLYLFGNRFINFLFHNDPDTADLAWARMIKKKEEGYSYSLFLSYLYQEYIRHKTENIHKNFPRGLPFTNVDNYYNLEDAINWLIVKLTEVPTPYLGYFHFLPPHRPYSTRQDFYLRFSYDGYKSKNKPEHLFSLHKAPSFLNKIRTQYDEYLLFIDAEFGRLFDYLEQNGLLENTLLILTSDHGEMFERGIAYHITPVLFQPLLHIPLLIFEPGRKSREDVYASTSAIDVLPTLLHITGQDIPGYCEGEVLPPYKPQSPKHDRSIFCLEAKNNPKYSPLKQASVSLVKNQFKLVYYSGYQALEETGDLIELYDIQNDPEELENLYPTRKGIGDELLNIVKAKLVEVNAPYV